MKRESFNSIVFGVGIFASFLVLALAKTTGGYTPFCAGFFVALVYARKNFLVVSPLYVLSTFLVKPELETLLFSGVLVLSTGLLYFVHYKLNRTVTCLAVNLTAFFAQIPQVVYALYSGETVFFVVVNALLTQIFTLCATLCLYAVLVRGMKTKFTVDESVCTCVTATALCLGLYSVNAFSITPFYLISTFVTVVITYSLGAIGLVSAVVFGLGAAFGGNYSVFLPLVVGATCALGFRTASVYACASVYSVACVAIGLYFQSTTGFWVVECVEIFVGALAFCVLPPKIKGELGAYLTAFREPKGERHVINRNRKTISTRLASAAKVFWDLSSLVSDTAYVANDEERVDIVVDEVEKAFCGNCSRREQCERILDGKTRELLYPVVEVAVKRGRATLLEIPAYITGSCIKVNELIPTVNSIRDEILNAQKAMAVKNGGKVLFAEQLLGVGELLAGFSQDMRRVVGFDLGLERVLIDELAYKNVLCSEAIIEESGDYVTLLVKDGEIRRRAIEKVVGKVMRKKMSAKIEKSLTHKGFDTITLSSTPKFDMAFGEAVASKEGERTSGDSRLVSRPSTDTYVMALADGMGSGERAERSSSRAVSLVESFYRAGFSHRTVINLVNKMLTFSEGEGYNTLDMCICNVREGKCDFIKMGSCTSFLKREDRVEVVESQALPMGVLREVSPTIVEKSVQSGDMLVLVSDGVMDSLGEEYLTSYIEQSDTPNPQELANKILSLARGRNKNDDATVVVGKVF